MRLRDVTMLLFVAAACLANSAAAEKSTAKTTSFFASVQSISADSNPRFLRGESTENEDDEERVLGLSSIPGFDKLTNLFKTKITPRKWSSKGKFDYALHKYGLDKAGVQLFDSPKINDWATYMTSVVKSNPEAAMLRVLKARYTDDALWMMFEAGKKAESTTSLATKLQARQIEDWLASQKTPDYVFKILQLNKDADDILGNHFLTTWIDYMKRYNSKPENKKNRVSLIATLTANYKDRGVLEIIEAAKKIQSTSLPAKRLEAEQVQFWIKEKRTPDELLTVLSLDKAGDQLLASPRFQTWSKFINYYNKENPDQATTVVAKLMEHLGDETLTPILVAARKVESTKSTAAKLQAEQFKSWLGTDKDPDEIFKLLQLDKAADDLLSNPQLSNWLKYVEDLNLKPTNEKKQASTINILRDNFDDDVLANTILAGKQISSSQNMAQRFEDDLFKGWMINFNTPDDVFRHLKLNEAGEKIFQSPLWGMYTNFLERFNKVDPERRTTMISALARSYEDDALAKILISAEKVPSTEKLATKLQTDQIGRWLADKDTPEDIFSALRLDEAVDDVLTNPLLNTWATYLTDFNVKFPSAKVSMVDTFRTFFRDTAIVKMLNAAKEVESTRKVASDLEASLINKWVLAKKVPEGVKKMAGTDEASTNLLARYTTKYKETYEG